MRPDWSFVMVGPVVKISQDELPQRPNIHYLGGKTYDSCRPISSGWDVALMPFAINESTQFISPTKTPEYLAGGKPVVSTPITRRHPPLWRARRRQHRRDRRTSSSRRARQALELARNPESGWLAEADLMLSAVELGHDPGAHGRPDRRAARRSQDATRPRCSSQPNERAVGRQEAATII